MLQLEFPNYTFKIKNNGNGDYIFDEIRKKYIKLTKEEWVRHNCVKFLINDKNLPSVLINIEKTEDYRKMSSRGDGTGNLLETHLKSDSNSMNLIHLTSRFEKLS